MKSFMYIISIFFVLIIAPAGLLAEDTNDLKPVLCAVTDTYDCGFGQDCVRGSAADINIPLFLDIDFKNETITGTRDDGSERTTKLVGLEHMRGGVIIHGAERGLGFSISINIHTNKFTGARSGDQVGFVVFGACKPK